MIYDKPRPHIDNILWLARLSMPFPATARNVAEVAESWRFSKSTLDFLDLFPQDEVFSSREEFMTRCEELELLLRQEIARSQAIALSSQG